MPARYPFSMPKIVPYFVAKKLSNEFRDGSRDVDFVFGGSTLAVLAEQRIDRQSDPITDPEGRNDDTQYIVQRYKNTIFIKKCKTYVQDWAKVGFQFERKMTNKEICVRVASSSSSSSSAAPVAAPAAAAVAEPVVEAPESPKAASPKAASPKAASPKEAEEEKVEDETAEAEAEGEASDEKKECDDEEGEEKKEEKKEAPKSPPKKIWIGANDPTGRGTKDGRGIAPESENPVKRAPVASRPPATVKPAGAIAAAPVAPPIAHARSKQRGVLDSYRSYENIQVLDVGVYNVVCCGEIDAVDEEDGKPVEIKFSNPRH